MTTRLTKDARLERQPPSFLASRGFVARRSRSRSLPSVNLKKKRDCSQSRLDREQCPNFEGLFIIITKVIKSHVKLLYTWNLTLLKSPYTSHSKIENFSAFAWGHQKSRENYTWNLTLARSKVFFCLLQYFRVALNWPLRKPTLFARLARSLAIT